jgi:hypothetical protein
MRGVQRWGLPLLVAGPMVAVGALVPAAVFPEGAAIAFGVWTMGVPGWCASWWRVVALPTACALAGLGLAVLPGPRWVAEAAAVTVALAVLQGCRSRLGPSLSAAVFPIVFGVDTWVYPVTVCAVCVAVAAGGRLTQRGRVVALPPRWGWAAVGGVWVVAVVWVAVCGLVPGVPQAALAPPLLVSGLEWMVGGARRAATGLRRWAVLTGAALLGSGAVWLCPVRWAGGLAALSLALVLLRVAGEHHPPALAIALIPVVLDAPVPWTYTAGIALGAAAVHLLGLGRVLWSSVVSRALGVRRLGLPRGRWRRAGYPASVTVPASPAGAHWDELNAGTG